VGVLHMSVTAAQASRMRSLSFDARMLLFSHTTLTGVHAICGCQQAQQRRQAVRLSSRGSRLCGINRHERARCRCACWARCLRCQLVSALLHAQRAQRVGRGPIGLEGRSLEG